MNQILGTHIIGPKYHFYDEDSVIEGAKRIYEMGSKIVKIRFESFDKLKQISDIGFDEIFLWYDNPKPNEEIEDNYYYQNMYNLVKYILTTFKNTNKSFFIGHWEGDWLINHYVPKENITKDAKEINIKRMINCLNVKRKAFDKAKEDFGLENVNVYIYAELNRVIDYIDKGLNRFVNKVLPYIDMDFISYSAYDLQNESKEKVHEVLDFIESKMKQRSVEGFNKRVFIGEFGICAETVKYDEEKHKLVNLEIIGKFLSWGVPFIIYWEFYNNEVNEDLSHRGYWLIDNHNRKWPLYDFFKKYYQVLNENFENNSQEILCNLISDEVL